MLFILLLLLLVILFLEEPVFVCTETFRCVVMEAHVTHTNTADEEMGTLDPCHGDSYYDRLLYPLRE